MKPQHHTVNAHDLPKGSFVFAPSVIEDPRRRRRWLTDRRVEQLARAALVLAVLVTLAATLYLMVAGLPALERAL